MRRVRYTYVLESICLPLAALESQLILNLNVGEGQVAVEGPIAMGPEKEPGGEFNCNNSFPLSPRSHLGIRVKEGL